MSTTDVAPFVTATYTPTLPVTDDSSVLTNADLKMLTLSLANRTEFLRALSAEAAIAPEVFCTLREDFLDADYNSARNTLYGVIPWTTVASGAGAAGLSINHVNGTAKNPGQLVCACPGTLGDSNFAFFLGPSAGNNPFSFATLDAMVIVGKIAVDTSTLLTPFVRAGLAQNGTLNNGGTDTLGIAYGPAFGANWLLFKRVASVQTTFVLAPMVIGEHVVFLFQKNAANGIDVYVNGALTTTVAAAALPAGTCTFGTIQGISGAEGATTIQPAWDMLTIRTKPNNRSGV